jgi:hypothetical protein
LETLTHQRQKAVAERRQLEQQRIAPELQHLQEIIDAAQARCAQLDAAISDCPRARMLLMAAGRPAGRSVLLLRWLRGGLMSLGAAAAILMAWLLFSWCKLRWAGSAATK